MGIAVVYAAYLAISIGLTVIVASALSRSGRVYLAHAFGGDEGMAAAVNRMLVVGFCLLSLGYAALTTRTSGRIAGVGQAAGVLSVKVGEELLVLGALQLVNMILVTRFRRRQEWGGLRGAADRPGTAASRPGTTTPGWAGTATVPDRPGATAGPIRAASAAGRPGTTTPGWAGTATVPDRPGATAGPIRAASTAGPEVAASPGLPGAAGPSAPDPGAPADPAAPPAAPTVWPPVPATGRAAPVRREVLH